MWLRVIRLFAKSLSRIAAALEEIRDLYKLDCEARGIVQLKPGVVDQTEIAYGYIDDERH